MKRTLSAILLLASSVALAAPPAESVAPIRLPALRVSVAPPAPPPADGVAKLTGDELFVIDSDAELFVLCSPAGAVKVSAEPGPLRIRGKFVDGEKTETRLFKGKHVYIVEAAQTGRCELVIVPKGLTEEKAIIRRVIDVDAGQGPIPPPKPKPDPNPKPVPVAAAWVIVVEESSARTAETAAILNDSAMWQRIEAKGVKWRVYDPNSPEVKAKKYDQVLAAVGLPGLILLDTAGNVVAKQKLPLKSSDLESLVK